MTDSILAIPLTMVVCALSVTVSPTRNATSLAPTTTLLTQLWTYHHPDLSILNIAIPVSPRRLIYLAACSPLTLFSRCRIMAPAFSSFEDSIAVHCTKQAPHVPSPSDSESDAPLENATLKIQPLSFGSVSYAPISDAPMPQPLCAVLVGHILLSPSNAAKKRGTHVRPCRFFRRRLGSLQLKF